MRLARNQTGLVGVNLALRIVAAHLYCAPAALRSSRSDLWGVGYDQGNIVDNGKGA
jgi:hypothetical protein